MKKIIIHRTHYGNVYYDASTPTLEAKALKKMFSANDADGFYDSIEECITDLSADIKKIEAIDLDSLPDSARRQVEMDKGNILDMKRQLGSLQRELELYTKAKKGDSKAINLFLSLRKNAEYEEWDIEEVY